MWSADAVRSGMMHLRCTRRAASGEQRQRLLAGRRSPPPQHGNTVPAEMPAAPGRHQKLIQREVVPPYLRHGGVVLDVVDREEPPVGQVHPAPS